MSEKIEDTLRKEFGNKVIIAGKAKSRRCFMTNKSLDNSLESGKVLDWFNIKDLCNDGYTTILHNQKNLVEGYKPIETTPADEINSLVIINRDNNYNVPTDFREVYDNLVEENPIIVRGNDYLDFYKPDNSSNK